MNTKPAAKLINGERTGAKGLGGQVRRLNVD